MTETPPTSELARKHRRDRAIRRRAVTPRAATSPTSGRIGTLLAACAMAMLLSVAPSSHAQSPPAEATGDSAQGVERHEQASEHEAGSGVAAEDERVEPHATSAPPPRTEVAAEERDTPVEEDLPPDGQTGAEEEPEEADNTAESGLAAEINETVGTVVGYMATVLFFEVFGMPFIVLWLMFGAVFFTIRMNFINVRAFKHAIDVVRGRFDDPEDEGEVSHFQALSSALSATVGLGNIAGVAVAVTAGGPGAVFWMVIAALFGMTSKFTECTLGVKYRRRDEFGNVLGGPMRYLEDGLAKRGLRPLGKTLAVIFMIFCIGGSLGGGNMFQANQAYNAVNEMTGYDINPFAFAAIVVVLVGIVILGGIRRIAATAEKIVPVMCGVYVLAALFIVFTNLEHVPHAVNVIVTEAFTGGAVAGGFLGVLIQGVKRAAFSNEAGIGSAAIAHSAAKTAHPVREGVVALLEPFIDTVIACSATGIVIVVSGVYETSSSEGAVLTAEAFGTVISWFPAVLTLAIVLFAYSTMISWSYYGERCWTNLFGAKSSLVYRIIFLGFIVLGCATELQAVIDFSDLMILSMAFPNIAGLLIMSGEVKQDLDVYMGRLERGEFKTHG